MKGLRITDIANKIGVPRQKLYDINRGGSSADDLILQKLENAFPELQSIVVNDEEKTLPEEVKDLREKLDWMHETLQNVVEERDTLYDAYKRMNKELVELHAQMELLVKLYGGK